MPRLDVYVDLKLALKVRLKKESILLGRGAECDVQIPNPRVSREHVRIDWREEDESHWIENLSARGARINHLPLVVPTHLHVGDRIYLENYVVIFQADDAEPEVLANESTDYA
ncbi:MAG TPA: FHA domain-containing protein [Thermoanaerobaculia bacterium]|jgi:pSer/pThr/pTyr-binding forkhead associated (FHA) protein